MKYRKFVPPGDPVNCRWLPVVGYEGFYSVSDTGLVKSEPRQVPNHTGLMWTKGSMTAQSFNKDGYPIVNLRAGPGRQQLCCVHRLVITAFRGPTPEGMQTAHNDNDRTNAHLDNLRYDTPRNNILDKVKFGTMPRGETHPHSRLTAEMVREIRSATSTRDLAEKFGVSVTTIKNVRSRRVWTHAA